MPITNTVDLRGLANDELISKLREAKEELFNLRFQAATGQLESHGRLRASLRLIVVRVQHERGRTRGPQGS